MFRLSQRVAGERDIPWEAEDEQRASDSEPEEPEPERPSSREPSFAYGGAAIEELANLINSESATEVVRTHEPSQVTTTSAVATMAVTSATQVTFTSWAPIVTARSVTSALNPDSRPFEFTAGGSAFVLPVAHSSLRTSPVVVEEAGRLGAISDRRSRGDSEAAEPVFPVAGRPHPTPCSSVGSIATSVAFGERSRGVGVRVLPERTSADRVRRSLPWENDTRNEIRSGIFPFSTLSFPFGRAVSFGPSMTEYYTPELDEDEIRERQERPTTRLGRTLGASRANSGRADRVREEYGGAWDFFGAEALRSGRLVDQIVRGWRISFSGDDDMTTDKFLNRVEEESALVGLTDRELLCVLPALLSDLALDWYWLRRHQWRTWAEFRTAFSPDIRVTKHRKGYVNSLGRERRESTKRLSGIYSKWRVYESKTGIPAGDRSAGDNEFR
ncbi:hypothetical protein KPH14_000935 [Odynerus spinipes]|uniref:Uncharacterized protein n=1 Tax=Odynerus spinipes TaxID=1348599 RepID=A0AAD9RDK7_9HYME|nr:hypothetical protein KPH14_000935 [Odynerus spinipes]